MASALTFDALLAAVPFVLLVLVGLTLAASIIAGEGRPGVELAELFARFLPAHASIEADPFALAQRLLVLISQNRGELSLYAIPAFIWFSTRLFAGVRTALNHIYDVSALPRPGGFVRGYLLGKVRDTGMVLVTLSLFLGNTAVSAGIGVLRSRPEADLGALGFFLTTIGRGLGELLTFGFAVLLFFVVYKYASVRRMGWRPALVASFFTAIAFEIAKRLFGLYLENFASPARLSLDFNLVAGLLFVLWMYYNALTFLLGGVVAETWQLREMQQRQRAVLT